MIVSSSLTGTRRYFGICHCMNPMLKRGSGGIKYSKRAHKAPQNLIYLHINIKVSRNNDDHEWLRMNNAFILCDLFEHF